MNWSAVGDKAGKVNSMVGLAIAVFSGMVVILAIILLRIEEQRRTKRQELKRKARA